MTQQNSVEHSLPNRAATSLLAELPIFVFGIGSVAKRVLLQGLTYLSPRKLRRIEKEMRRIRDEAVPGDVLEFGVALGGSAIVLAHHIRGSKRRFFGFDVFSQIPAPTSEHDDQRSRDRYEIIQSGKSRGIRGKAYYGYEANLLKKVKEAFGRFGLEVDDRRRNLVQGLFEDTWPRQKITRVAFAHLDCDWYDPVRYCLEQLADRMVPGGAIMLDDYNDYGGCRTAVDQFIAGRSDFQFEPGANPILRKLSVAS